MLFSLRVKKERVIKSIKNERRSRSISTVIVRTLVDVVIQSIWELLATTVDLKLILKISIFVLIVRCCYQLLGCLLIVFFIVWLLI